MYLKGLEGAIAHIKSLYDQPLDLEKFVKPLNDGYHSNGHMAVSNCEYTSVILM